MRYLAVIATMLLAACGDDNPPLDPEAVEFSSSVDSDIVLTEFTADQAQTLCDDYTASLERYAGSINANLTDGRICTLASVFATTESAECEQFVDICLDAIDNFRDELDDVEVEAEEVEEIRQECVTTTNSLIGACTEGTVALLEGCYQEGLAAIVGFFATFFDYTCADAGVITEDGVDASFESFEITETNAPTCFALAEACPGAVDENNPVAVLRSVASNAAAAARVSQ